MNPLEMIVDRTPAEQKIFVEKMRRELKPYGYSVVSTEWKSAVLKVLQPKALGKMMVAAE